MAEVVVSNNHGGIGLVEEVVGEVENSMDSS